ncbi:enoyl-CoA hydratase/isomerase family protein [Aeromicrobium sp.]|uniref:enoyl-CoA hydratase/isomerase family protein n=1 Tax=Aeromicrobium sp. TaxID=1871063 RepID=UPI0025B97389|nr:enoyl-CoA hydratase/isomerase family protein [Aeromicrobium sp.]MCK5892590.1 enoyl-CoA hydratase/isomerase family protein [Aeromicrobium sp.]
MGDPGRETVSLAVDDGVATITIDRPDRHNALDLAAIHGLRRAADAVRDDETVHVVVLRGVGGRAFSTGVDLDVARSERILEDGAAALRFTATIRDTLLAIETLPVPTVAAIDGFALAGGLELALACDLAVCTDRSRLGDQHAAYDLVPGAGGSQRLPRRIGTQRALELLLTGRHLDGPEAERIGLVVRSVPAEALGRALSEITDRLRATSRAALVTMKAMVTEGSELRQRDALEHERLLSQEYFVGRGDAVAGLAAFAARERPTASPGPDLRP